MPSLSTELRAYQLGELSPHPWQKNVPDIRGQEWTDFLADIQRRGIVEPIRVSTRLGYPVIVDGHQRHRAATELGLELIDAYVQQFDSEAEEVEFLAAAARLRRHLSDSQKVTLTRAYEAYFKPVVETRKGGRPKKSHDVGVSDTDQKPTQDFGQVSPSRHDRTVESQAAAVAGLNRETYRQGKIVQDRAPAPVKQAWEREEISTNAAHQLTRAPDPIRQALESEEIDVYQALRVEKDKTLRKAVETGEKTVQEAVSLADAMKAAQEQQDTEMGAKPARKMQDLLQRIMDLDARDYMEVLTSRHNQEVWQGSFGSDWQEAIRHMKALAQVAEGKERTITLDALN